MPLRGRFLEPRLRLVETCQQVAGVDLGKDLALPHEVALFHVHAEKAADRIGADRHLGARVGDDPAFGGDAAERSARVTGRDGRRLRLGLGLHDRAREEGEADSGQ